MVTTLLPPSAVEDARPILPRSDRTLWAIADDAREKLCAAIEAAASAQGVSAAITKSPPYQSQPWVLFEAWPRLDVNTTRRGSFRIEINPKPGHRFALEYFLKYDVGGKVQTLGPLSDTPPADVLVAFALGRRAEPNVDSLELRTAWWHVWRPANRLVLKQHRFSAAAGYVAAVGVLLLLGGGVFPPGAGIGVLCLLASLVLWILGRGETELVCDAGRPQNEPRVLRIIDSWQAVISGLGADQRRLQLRFRTALGALAPVGINHGPEEIGYWTPDGRVERTQYVLRLRRSVVFVQIYAYGDDLYIGWDGHLNSGSWREKTIGYGVDERSGKKARYTTVEPAQTALSEYDLSDANVLMELTHAQLVRLTRDLMVERKIDQEIDFKIVRGNRQGLTGDHSTAPPDKPAGMFGAALGGLRGRA